MSSLFLFYFHFTGLQMLHILLKRYRKVFSKTPILRKLLKVNLRKCYKVIQPKLLNLIFYNFRAPLKYRISMQVLEFLAETKILTLDNILKPSLNGGERSEQIMNTVLLSL